MTETQPTVADKRQWLRDNGYDVASRGRLSAEHEQAYASGQPANVQTVVETVDPDAGNLAI